MIDADRLSEIIRGNVSAPYEDSREAKEECLRIIEDALTIDAVPVTRCKDCKHEPTGWIGIMSAPTVDVGPVARWIPVGEKLPEIGETVLVIASGGPKPRKELRGAVEIATLYADKPQPDWMLEAWPDWADPEVTHWMPMPEPPENLIKEDC